MALAAVCLGTYSAYHASHASPKNRPAAALCRATRWVQTTSGSAACAARLLKPYRPICLCELFTMSVPRDVVIATFVITVDVRPCDVVTGGAAHCPARRAAAKFACPDHGTAAGDRGWLASCGGRTAVSCLGGGAACPGGPSVSTEAVYLGRSVGNEQEIGPE